MDAVAFQQKRIGASRFKERTLTNLYNECPTWLPNAHAALARRLGCVRVAGGWGLRRGRD